MAKVYDTKQKKMVWVDDGITCAVEDAWFEVCDVLAVNKLDGHDMYDQWLMKVEDRLHALLDVLGDEPSYNINTLLTDSKITF